MNSYITFDLDILFGLNFFSHLDYFFARSMATAFKEKDSIVLTSCALVSKTLFEGHICLDLNAIAKTTRSMILTANEQVRFPDLDTWTRALKNSPMVSDTVHTPLVLDGDSRLYFSKYYDFQDRLATNIAQRILQKPLKMDEAIIEQMLESSFIRKDDPADRQKRAVKNALLKHFSIISGGPGTGKTFVSTIIKKMVLLYARKQGLPDPEIMCVAPTGKAASKMEQGSTIHSILKPLSTGPGFYHNQKNPLRVDVMIIDEASMIDISLLTRLLEAIPLEARIIIIGDKYQLSSIQAGSVFCDICNANSLSGSIFFLEHNFRSKGKTGIENLSKAINHNDDQSLEKILTSGKYPDVVFEGFPENVAVSFFIKKYVIEGYQPFVMQDTVEAALDQLDNFKILCAHNSGEYGTLQINHICEKILRSEDNFDIQEKIFKKIIMVNTNDYIKKIFNGETGIIFEEKGKNNTFFASSDGGIKHFRSSDLPGFDAAFAITIHKSQGSEFDTVLMIIPDRISPVVTRQLLYTGVTRAKKKVIIMGNMEVIKAAIKVSVTKNSGISDYLEREILKGCL